MLAAILILAGCSDNLTGKEPAEGVPEEEMPLAEEPQPPSQEEILRAVVEKMTVGEKIGQLLMAGFEGTQISERERSLIEDYGIGGFIFFGRNITDGEGTRNLLDSLKGVNSKSGIPLLLAVDEEGGSVTRLSGIYRNLPPQSRLGEEKDATLAYNYGYIQGEKLKRLGFNVDFSPVLDVDSNPENPVIGNRAISDNPEAVAELGVKVMEGIRDQGIIPVGKHYPGHGDTAVDSHTSLPLVHKTMEELMAIELVPFQKAIEEGIPAIMVGHLLVPSLDNVPSSLSKATIQELLRDVQGFSGVVFSDDLTMGAITAEGSVSEAAVQFIIAGGDIALVCHGEAEAFEAYDAIMRAWEEGLLSDENLDKRVMRILRLKDDFRLQDSPVNREYKSSIDDMIEGLIGE